MSEELTKSQQILLWDLFAAGGEKLNKDITPKPKAKDRKALITRGLIKVSDFERTKLLELQDGGWRWIVETEPFPISANEKRVTAERRLLQSLMRGIKRYATANDKQIQDLFRVRTDNRPERLSDGSRPSSKDTEIEDNAVEKAIRTAFFEIAGRPAQGNIRLSRLRSKLDHISRDKVDATLLEMWRAKKANLMNLDNPRDIEAEREAALKTSVHTFHVVRITE